MSAHQSPAPIGAGEVTGERDPRRVPVAVQPEGGVAPAPDVVPPASVLSTAGETTPRPPRAQSDAAGTGADGGAPGQDTGSARVTRSADCPEDPAQARRVHHDPAAPAYGFIPRRTALLRQVRDRAARARLDRDQMADRLGLAGPRDVALEDVRAFQRVAAEAQYCEGVRTQVAEAAS